LRTSRSKDLSVHQIATPQNSCSSLLTITTLMMRGRSRVSRGTTQRQTSKSKF